MKSIKTVMINLMFFFLTTILVSCSKQTYTNGYFYDKAKAEKNISANKTNESEVIKILGTPTAVSNFGDRTFFYIGRKYEKESFLNPNLKEQSLISIAFNQNHIVKNIKYLNAANSREVVYETAETPFQGNSMSVLEQLFGNIGKFTAPGSKKPGI